MSKWRVELDVAFETEADTVAFVNEVEKVKNKSLLCPNIISIEFGYWDDCKRDWDKKWDTDWVQTKGKLPERVKVIIKAKMPKGEEMFTTISEIMLQDPIEIKWWYEHAKFKKLSK